MESKNWREAFIAMRGALPPIVKDSTNPHFRNKYAALDGIIDTVTPVLADHGFFVVQPVVSNLGEPSVDTLLFHVSQEEPVIRSSYPLEMSENPQKVGSAVTYARRYGICALLGIAAEDDDDANTAASRGGGGRQETRSSPEDDKTQAARRAMGQVWAAMSKAFGGISPWEREGESFALDALSKQRVLAGLFGRDRICGADGVPVNNRIRAMIDREPDFVISTVEKHLEEAISAEHAHRKSEVPF